MTISFSGLASGIDTSSWIDSLVSLKQAKIDTLEEDKKTVLLSQETLNNIKSFFSSFRDVIEKVTDAKFGIPTMDLFAQNIATSANLDVLTATATTEAEEATYDVLVDNLATSTQAMSGLPMLNTIIQTATATIDSKLVDIGVKTGDIGVTVSGIQHIISIEENDTIGSFIEKLQNIGVDASFNDKTGIFGINLDDGAIDDTIAVQADGSRGTGIVDALHLSELGGYESKSLEYSTTETIVSTATEDTKISDLGEIKAGNIIVKANDTQYTISIDQNTTIKDLLNKLHANGITAELDNSGVLTISDAEIIDSSGTGIMEALGLETDIHSKTQVADDLKYQTIVTTVTEATSGTKLEDLTVWDSIGSNPVLVAQNSNGQKTTINVNGTMTIGDIINSLNSAGLSASINNDGVLSISGGSVSGNVAEALGIKSGSGNTGEVSASGNILYSKEVAYATGDTTLKELGIDISKTSDGYKFAVFDTNNQLKGELAITENTSINDILNQLSSYGINGSINEGRITLTTTNGAWVKGSIPEALGLATLSEVVISTTNQASSSPIQFTETKAIETTTTFEQAGINAAGKTMDIKTKDGGSYVATVTITSNSQTFGDLFYMLDDYGITASISDGVISLASKDYYVSGSLADALGIEAKKTSDSKTVGATVTSTASLTYTSTVAAQGSSHISDYVNVGSGSVIELHNQSGATSTYTINNSTTFDNLISAFSSAGISATFSGGVLSFNSTNGAYVEDSSGNVLAQLGISTKTVSDTRTTNAIAQTSSSTVYYTVGAEITEDTYITAAVNLTSSNNKLIIEDSQYVYTTLQITNTMTFGDLKDRLSSYGITMTINSNGSLSLSSSSGRYVKGSFADAIGWDCNETITTVGVGRTYTGSAVYTTVTVGNTQTSSSQISKTVITTTTATMTSRVSNFTNSSFIVIGNSNNNSFKSVLVSGSDTFSSLSSKLNSLYGITITSDSDGVFTFNNSSSAPQYYVETSRGLGKDFGLTKTSYTTTVPAFTSDGEIQGPKATLDTKLSDIIDGYSSMDKKVYIKSSAGNILKTVTLTSTSTLGVFNSRFTTFGDYSISASVTDGVLTLTNTPMVSNNSISNVYLEGDVIDALGIGVADSGTYVTRTVGTTATGTETLSKPTGGQFNLAASKNSTMDGLIGGNDITLESGDTFVVSGNVNEVFEYATFTVTQNSTLGTFIDFLSSNFGVTASIELGGKLTISGDENHYVRLSGVIKSSSGSSKGYTPLFFGLSGNDTTRQIMGKKIVSSTKTLRKTVTTNPTLYELGLVNTTSATTISIPFLDHNISWAAPANATVGDLVDYLSDYVYSISYFGRKINITTSVDNPLDGSSNFWSTLFGPMAVSYGSQIQRTYIKNGSTKKLTYTTSSSVAPDKDTKLNELGISSGNYAFTIGVDGTLKNATFTVTSTSTLQSFIDFMDGYGIDVTLNNAYVDGITMSIAGDDTHYIKSFDSTLANAFKLSGKTFYNSTSKTITASTTFGDLGLNDSYYYVTIGSNGTNRTEYYYCNSGTTVNDFLQWLDDEGVDATLSNGRITLNSSGKSTYLYGLENALANALGLTNLGNGNSCNVNTYTEGSNSTSDVLGSSETKKLTLDTKWDELGLSTGKINVFNTNNGAQYFTASSSSTVGDFVNWVNNNVSGVTASVSNGLLTLTGSSSAYITQMDSTFKNVFHLSSGEGETYVSSGKITMGNTNSNKQQQVTTVTADSNTTLGSLGLSSPATITVKNNGATQTITVNSSTTLSALKNALPSGVSLSVSSGKVTLTGSENAWIESMSSSLKDALKLNGVGNGYTYNTSGVTRYENTNSPSLDVVTTSKITGTTVINKINGYSNGNGKIAIHKADGNTITININETGTLNDFFNQIAGYGITGNIDSQGRVSLQGDGDAYLESVSGGSNILDILNLGSVSKTNKTIYSNATTGSLSTTNVVYATSETKLENLQHSDGSKINFDASGNASLVLKTTDENGVVKNMTVNFSKTQTLGSVLDYLSGKGVSSFIDASGKLSLNSNSLADFDVSGTIGSFLMGSYNKTYDVSNSLSKTEVTTSVVNATRDTLLSDLGVTSGEYYIYQNGVKYTAMISSDETLGSFMDTLNTFGIQTGMINSPDGTKLVIVGSGNSYISKSNSATNASNVVEKLFGTEAPDEKFDYSGLEEIYTTVTTNFTATEDTLISTFDTPWGDSVLKSAGQLVFSVNGESKVLEISEDETFGSLIDKLQDAGVEATFAGGKLYISDRNGFSIDTAKTTSSIINPNANIHLTDKDHIDGFMESSTNVIQTTTVIEELTLSVANYADYDTKMGLLNISDGTLSLYRNGERAVIDIHSDETFAQLRARIASKFSDVDISFDNGYIKIYSKDGNKIEIGATTDTSNFDAITGLKNNEEEGSVESSRELYRVNTSSLLTESGLFRKGDVTEGSFVIGNATFNITDTTTLADLISQINSNEEANATAYWDSVQGKFVITSRTTGSALINIEAGTSNFTDIMGYTETKWKSDGSVESTKMNVDLQEMGENAIFSINGTTYYSASNTVTSDISRIKGVTLNLKGLTEGSAVTVTVEKDKEAVADAISNVVDAYNELITNVDESIAIGGNLHDQSLLKLIRNQLRNMMTSSDAGATVFRNLDAIGITVNSANANNISTDDITELSFDKDKFIEAFDKDKQAVKELLVGGLNNTGVFTKVEDLLESSLKSVTGYFDTADDAYQSEIDSIDYKINKQQTALEKYRAQLEAKFSSMDILIGNLQQQYSSFLGT